MSHEPNRVPPEWLAGYVDGELSPPERAAVERLLADQPEWRTLLDDQEALAPTNVDYWPCVAAPTPTAAQWQRVQQHVQATSEPTLARRSGSLGRWLAAVSLVTTAASLLLLAAYNRSFQEPRPTSPAADVAHAAPVDEALGFLHMALAGDIEIHCLPEELATLLISGSHPLGSEMLQLARSDDIEFHGIGADPEGRFPEDPKMPQAKEPPPPVLWAPNAP